MHFANEQTHTQVGLEYCHMQQDLKWFKNTHRVYSFV